MDRTRTIHPAERSGVLRPENLERFSAVWIAPADALRDVVDTYWAVRWSLPHGETITQRIIDHPSVTFSIERGDVPHPFVVTSCRRRAWSRTLRGAGEVFGIRLRPAGLAVLSDLDARSLVGEQALDDVLDSRAAACMRRIAAHAADGLAGAADRAVLAMLAERPLRAQQRLANAALDLIEQRPEVRRSELLAELLGTSVRTLHRTLRACVGRGPAEIARRVRQQEVVRRLTLGSTDIAGIAAELGYADQAHLTNDFRAAVGSTPGAYVRELIAAQTALIGD